MFSILCLILAAVLLFVGLLVFAGLLLWCETFQINKGGGVAATATTNKGQQGNAEAETDAAAKAREEAAAALTKSEAEAEANMEAEAKAKAEEEATAKAKANADEAAALVAKETESQEASKDDASGKTDADGDGLPDIETATAEQAAEAFREDLDSGVVRQEEQLGILYNQSPDDIDDLKLIKGVAKVLEGRLHESDVFRFKQVALWTDTAAREFGAKLSFRDRIFRDDWIAQAKRFHQEKYGEKL